MNTLINSPKQNRILEALPAAEYLRLEPELEAVPLSQGQVLYETDDTLDYLYFPTTSIVALIWATVDGAAAALAMTGNDGVVGKPAVIGRETSSHRVIVQSAGNAYRVRSEVARWVFDQGGEFPSLVILYTQALMSQIALTALCNRHHSIEQQLCRWLLLCLDRLPDTHLNTTQAMIANMLGARRVAVSEAAGKLQAAGLITYSRGQITILDRSGLEARTCECYVALEVESDRFSKSIPKIFAHPRARVKPTNLRARAERRHSQTKGSSPHSPGDLERQLHELQVHQIELEMQNEELAHAYAESDAVRERYADIYDFAPLAYVTVDTIGVIRQLNLAGAILLDIKRSQITRHRFDASVSPSFRATFKRFLAEVLDGHTRMSCEIELSPTKNRGTATVLIEAIPDENGQECRMVVSDITAQKKSTKALREHEAQLRSIFLAMAEGVVFQTADGRLIEANPAAEEILGLSRDELLHRTSYDPRWQSIHEDGTPFPGDEHPTMVTLRTGKPLRNQVMGIRVPTGELRWISINSMPINSGEDGKPEAVVATFTDITECRRFELAMRENDGELGAAQSSAKRMSSLEPARAHHRSGK